MLEKLKNNSQLIILIIAIALLLLNIRQCNNSKSDAERYDKFDKSIAAINDTLKKSINAQGDTVFTKRAVQFELKELVNSESFKSLSEENKKFYNELQKVKGLVSSTQATINAQAEIIKNLSYGQGVVVTSTDVCFQKNSTKTIEDSTKSLKYKQTFTFGDKLTYNLKYSYKATIQTSFIRNPDKTISVEYKLDDPNAKMINGQSFIIPFPEVSKLEKFMEKNGRWFVPAVSGILFSGGVYCGYKLSH